MPARQGIREQRLADQILRNLAQTVQSEVRDPRLQGLNLVDVTISRDLAWADIYYVVPDSAAAEHGLETIERILTQSRGFLRSKLASRLSIRKLPQLRFHRDDTQERASEIDRLLGAGSKDS